MKQFVARVSMLTMFFWEDGKLHVVDAAPAHAPVTIDTSDGDISRSDISFNYRTAAKRLPLQYMSHGLPTIRVVDNMLRYKKLNSEYGNVYYDEDGKTGSYEYGDGQANTRSLVMFDPISMDTETPADAADILCSMIRTACISEYSDITNIICRHIRKLVGDLSRISDAICVTDKGSLGQSITKQKKSDQAGIRPHFLVHRNLDGTYRTTIRSCMDTDVFFTHIHDKNRMVYEYVKLPSYSMSRKLGPRMMEIKTTRGKHIGTAYFSDAVQICYLLTGLLRALNSAAMIYTELDKFLGDASPTELKEGIRTIVSDIHPLAEIHRGIIKYTDENHKLTTKVDKMITELVPYITIHDEEEKRVAVKSGIMERLMLEAHGAVTRVDKDVTMSFDAGGSDDDFTDTYFDEDEED